MTDGNVLGVAWKSKKAGRWRKPHEVYQGRCRPSGERSFLEKEGNPVRAAFILFRISSGYFSFYAVWR